MTDFVPYAVLVYLSILRVAIIRDVSSFPNVFFRCHDSIALILGKLSSNVFIK